MLRACLISTALFATTSAIGSASAQQVSGRLLEVLADQPSARVVVVFEPPGPEVGDRDARRAIIRSDREDVLARLAPGQLRLVHVYDHVSAVAGELDAAGLEVLRQDPRVVAIGLDEGGEGTLAQSVPMVGASLVVGAGLDGAGVTVAVVDSGIDESHPDLHGAVVAEHCFCEDEDGSGCCPDGSVEQDGPGAAMDGNWHGTFVAGVVASRGEEAPAGVAPGVDLVAVRVMDASNTFYYVSQVTAGLDWLLSDAVDVDVVNLSLSTYTDHAGFCDEAEAHLVAMSQAIGELRGQGTLVFASSGNDGSTTAIGAPACISHATTVGAVYDADVGTFDGGGCWDMETRADQVCCFSDSSEALDLLAPGAWITSSALGSTAWNSWGTSFASPHAAGAAALLRQLDPGLDADEIEALLLDTGVSVTDDRTSTVYPRLDVLAAVQTYPETCDDGGDDNFDGDADCADGQCAGATGPAGEPCEPDGEQSCDDGHDNDNDGRPDCDDADCREFAHCQSSLDEAGGCACRAAPRRGAAGRGVLFALSALALVWARRKLLS